VTDNNATIAITLAGSEADLAGIDSASINLGGVRTDQISSSQLAQLKSGQTTLITINNLNANTNYTATLQITGRNLDANSIATQQFRTLPLYGQNLQPIFNSNNFYQTTVGVTNVTTN